MWELAEIPEPELAECAPASVTRVDVEAALKRAKAQALKEGRLTDARALGSLVRGGASVCGYSGDSSLTVVLSRQDLYRIDWVLYQLASHAPENLGILRASADASESTRREIETAITRLWEQWQVRPG